MSSVTSAPSAAELLSALPALGGHTVLVAGDVCLDDYHIGRAERLSREAPVPVLEFEERRQIAGGAANPAANIAALGGRAVLLGLVGQDAEGASLRAALQRAGIDASGLVSEAGRGTAVKLRVVARGELHLPQQLARIDRLERRPLSAETEPRVIERLTQILPRTQAVLFSDYRAGFVSLALVDAARSAARANGCLLTADSQGDLSKYHGFALVKCNHTEVERYLGRSLTSEADFESAIRDLMARLHLHALLITRGADGLSVGTSEGAYAHLPAANRSEVFDVTGAGDTAIAVGTLALVGGAAPIHAAALANYAAGLVVRKLGNATLTLEELRWAIENWGSG